MFSKFRVSSANLKISWYTKLYLNILKMLYMCFGFPLLNYYYKVCTDFKISYFFFSGMGAGKQWHVLKIHPFFVDGERVGNISIQYHVAAAGVTHCLDT